MSAPANLASMTGYAREDGGTERVTWVWEIKSVNGRGLEVRSRLSNGLDHLEPVVRERASAVFSRGNVSVGLRLSRAAGDRRVAVNRDLLQQLSDAALEVSGNGPPPSIAALLTVPGVIEVSEPEPSDEDRQNLDAALLVDLDRALSGLSAARAEEGGRLGLVLSAHLDDIARLTSEAGKTAASQPEAIRAKLAARIDELVDGDAGIPSDRLAQEVALLAVKADVREELDRLAGHVTGARALLSAGGAVGRRLDFLAQEFAREANTLCAKSAGPELTRLGLELKAAIDRLREQVQNLE